MSPLTDLTVLDTSGEAALANYLKSGGNYVGVHSASACLQQNTNYNQTVGAIFDYHPQLQPAVSPLYISLRELNAVL